MYVEWASEWNRSLDQLQHQLAVQSTSRPQALLTGSAACSLIATRHIAKTGGVSVREWMLGLEQQDRARYYGPATWMQFRGRCDGRKRYLYCCHPTDQRSPKECKVVPLTRARFLAVHELRRRSWMPSRRAPLDRLHDRESRVAETPLLPKSTSVALLEFHWPDSALGRWGEPHTFLQMLPRMRPSTLPGCRVVVVTVLRDPHTLYPSLQRHQYDAMREYGRDALRARCQCNLTSCDVVGFVRAFPNFQSWRLTSSRWVVPPLELVSHTQMYATASAILAKLDVVGVTERLDDFLQLVCLRAGIAPCGHVGHRNAKHARVSTKNCKPADPVELRAAISLHATADVKLHALAARRFQAQWEATQPAAGARAQVAPPTLFEEDRLAP